ncbi:hypothetical protein F4819DRAFT_483026 [Hypoxylon fuscum]|nr:hypothetical protein F4819DRAFT_483026 [Hypoxylon fuscum]
MRFSTIFVAWMALAGNAIGARRRASNNSTLRGNSSGLTYEEDILGDFHLDCPGFISPGTTNLAKTSSRHDYKPDDNLPWQELPKCYQDCFNSQCCNGWPMLGDVRNLTIHEWCHSKWIPAQNWVADHLQWCVKDACAGCRPRCRDDSVTWAKEVCANS